MFNKLGRLSSGKNSLSNNISRGEEGCGEDSWVLR